MKYSPSSCSVDIPRVMNTQVKPFVWHCHSLEGRSTVTDIFWHSESWQTGRCMLREAHSTDIDCELTAKQGFTEIIQGFLERSCAGQLFWVHDPCSRCTYRVQTCREQRLRSWQNIDYCGHVPKSQSAACVNVKSDVKLVIRKQHNSK